MNSVHVMNPQGGPNFSLIIIFSILLLGLSFFHLTYFEGGGWLGSNPMAYGRGFPFPYLTWDISRHSVCTINTPMTVRQIVHSCDLAGKNFIFARSAVGFISDIIFWITVSTIYLFIFCKADSLSFSYHQTLKILMVSLFIVSITYFIPVLTGRNFNIVIQKGAPFPYLTKNTIFDVNMDERPTNWEINLFTLVIDWLIVSLFVMVISKLYVNLKYLKS